MPLATIQLAGMMLRTSVSSNKNIELVTTLESITLSDSQEHTEDDIIEYVV